MPRGFPRKRIELFRNSGCFRYAISVVCAVEHREIHNVLSVRRVTADEDPLLHEGLFERISDKDLEGIPLTYPAWQRNSFNKQINYRQTRGSNREHKKAHWCMKQTQHNESVLGMFVRSRYPQWWKAHSTHQDVTHVERARAYPE